MFLYLFYFMTITFFFWYKPYVVFFVLLNAPLGFAKQHLKLRSWFFSEFYNIIDTGLLAIFPVLSIISTLVVIIVLVTINKTYLKLRFYDQIFTSYVRDLINIFLDLFANWKISSTQWLVLELMIIFSNLLLLKGGGKKNGDYLNCYLYSNCFGKSIIVRGKSFSQSEIVHKS